jgi:hypothetical protein
MVEEYKYAKVFYVHDEDDLYHEGTEYSDLQDAKDEAISLAEDYDRNTYVVTEVLTREIGTTAVERIVTFSDN